MWTKKRLFRAIALTAVVPVAAVIVLQCGTNPTATNAPDAAQTARSYTPVMAIAVGQTWTHQHIAGVTLDIESRTGTGFLTTTRVNGNQLVMDIPTGKLDNFLANPPGTWASAPTQETAAE